MKLFIFSCILTRPNGSGVTIKNAQGYRYLESEDEARGIFVSSILKESPEYSISQIICMTVPDDHIEQIANGMRTSSAQI